MAQTGWGASCSRDNSSWCSVKKTVLFIPGHRLFVYTRGVYSHQRPRGGERFDGLYSPVERLRRCLRGWRLVRDGWWFSCRAVSPISNTVGGLERRSRAADSGSTASIINLVSGRVARGSSGYTIPGLSFTASPASLLGLVIKRLEGSPEKGLVEGC